MVFDKLKSALFTTTEVEGDEAEEAAEQQTQKVVKPTKSTKAAPVRPTRPTRPAAASSVASSAGVDPKIRAVLDKDVEVAAKPAYSEFASIAKSMEAAVPDENQRLTAALSVVKAKGHDTKDVLFDIDECLAKLDEKEKAAAKTVDAAKAQVIGPRQKELAALESEAEKLGERLSQIRARSTVLEEEIQKETEVIEQNAEDLSRAITDYKEELFERKEKIASL